MERTKKRCLGFAGLSLVAAMTIVAANMPTPGAFATSTAVDTLKVRVLGGTPDVNITNIVSGAEYTDLSRTFGIDYERIDKLTVTSIYTNNKGETQEKVVSETTYDQGTGSLSLNLSDLAFGKFAYGKYVIKISGLGYDGVYDEDSTSFYYVPATAKSEVDEVTGKHYVDLDYNTSGDASERVAKFVINVYDESGKLVSGISPITVTPPTTRVEIPFAANGLPSGNYTIGITAYDADGNELYSTFDLKIEYKASVVPDAGKPDTGGLFQDLNIANEDYLISGLILFFVLGIVAFGVIARGRKNDPKRRH